MQIITRVSAGLPFLFTGSLLLESFFGIPGLVKVKEENEKVGLKLNIQKMKIMASGPIQGRTGESGAFGLWPHPRGSSRISS